MRQSPYYRRPPVKPPQKKNPFSVAFSAMRPGQWMKNLLVFGAWFFAVWDPQQGVSGWQAASLSFLKASGAFTVFCLLSSAVYLFNDIRDKAVDRLHPQKKFRMIASGALSAERAWKLAAACAFAGLAGAVMLGSTGFLTACAVYLMLQGAYSSGLKKIASVDVFLIATGFVLRAAAGAFVIGVRISPWLLLCVFLLSLFVALCKRRNERLLLRGDRGPMHRQALQGYGPIGLIDIQIAIAAACVVVCYAVYTLSTETIERFGTEMLVLTVPFVLFAIFRYLYLVYERNLGGRPERLFLSDWVMIATIAMWAATASAVLAAAAMHGA